MEASKLVPKDLDAATALPSGLSCLLQCLVGLADIRLKLLKRRLCEVLGFDGERDSIVWQFAPRLASG